MADRLAAAFRFVIDVRSHLEARRLSKSRVLHQLKAFNAIAEQGSIRGASRALSLSQPAVTKSLRELEETVGTALVHRGAKGIVLTQCGEAFFRRSRLILREVSVDKAKLLQAFS